MGVPCKQLHSYDYSGPYAAFTGAVNFYREVDRMVNTKSGSSSRRRGKRTRNLTASLVHPSRVEGREGNGSESQVLAPSSRTGGTDG